jgi:hypothetical protein
MNPDDRLGWIPMQLIEIPEVMSETDTSVISSSNCLVSRVHFESALQATVAL